MGSSYSYQLPGAETRTADPHLILAHLELTGSGKSGDYSGSWARKETAQVYIRIAY